MISSTRIEVSVHARLLHAGVKHPAKFRRQPCPPLSKYFIHAVWHDRNGEWDSRIERGSKYISLFVFSFLFSLVCTMNASCSCEWARKREGGNFYLPAPTRVIIQRVQEKRDPLGLSNQTPTKALSFTKKGNFSVRFVGEPAYNTNA